MFFWFILMAIIDRWHICKVGCNTQIWYFCCIFTEDILFAVIPRSSFDCSCTQLHYREHFSKRTHSNTYVITEKQPLGYQTESIFTAERLVFVHFLRKFSINLIPTNTTINVIADGLNIPCKIFLFNSFE